LTLPPDVHFRSLAFTDEATRGWMQILTDEEINRRAGMGNEQRRRSFTAGRIALRSLLAELLDLHPSRVPLVVEPSGRLSSPGSGLFLSLAHSGDLAVAAACERNVGVDLELIRPKPAALLDYILADDERAHVHGLALPPERSLFLCWTVKEAVLKANGTGLRKSPRRVRVNLDLTTGHALVHDPEDKAWDVMFALSETHALSLAVDPEAVTGDASAP
ncbi:MAG: 4'-phosphopantetheinyl transferase superfamily protein, partial [Bacteroidetes bacterium]|nr:4'-phosphopantetheinyl transferase superfamily protein [Bacteroidota bacterium]